MTAPERRRLIVLGSVLAVVAAATFWPRGSSPVSAREGALPSARRATTRSGAPVALSPELVPTLAPVDAKPGIAPVERDIFRFAPPTPTRVPTVPPPTPTPIPMVGSPRFIGPLPLPPTPTPTPIIPPAIPYKLLGMFGPYERLIAAFEENGRLINAREGDVLVGRFIVKKVNKESVDFSFVGLPSEITRRLPMETKAAK